MIGMLAVGLFGDLGSPRAAGWVGVILVALFADRAARRGGRTCRARAEPWANPLIGLASGAVAGVTGVAAVPFLPYMQSLEMDRHELVQALGIMFLFIIGMLAVALAGQGAYHLTNTRRRRRHRADHGRRLAGPARPPAGCRPRRSARAFMFGMFAVGLHMARALVVERAHAPARPQAHHLRHSRAAAALLDAASATCCRSSTLTSRVPPALDDFLDIDHELIRFDDVVAEYPGFEACTPRPYRAGAGFGERAHADRGSHMLVHCHAGISRSHAAAAILMCQHAPGQEEAAFLRLLELRKHGWPNTRMVEFADRC